MGAGTLLVLAAGVAMIWNAGLDWRMPWLVVAILFTLVLAGLGPAVTGKRMDAIHAACGQGEGPLPGDVQTARRDPVLICAFSAAAYRSSGQAAPEAA